MINAIVHKGVGKPDFHCGTGIDLITPVATTGHERIANNTIVQIDMNGCPLELCVQISLGNSIRHVGSLSDKFIGYVKLKESIRVVLSIATQAE
jgi:hypothetical protein